MNDRIIIAVGRDWDGFTFRLPPKARVFLSEEYPDRARLAQVSISFDEKFSFDSISGDVYKHIAEMLTGLPYNDLQSIGGARFVESVTEELIHDTVWI